MVVVSWIVIENRRFKNDLTYNCWYKCRRWWLSYAPLLNNFVLEGLEMMDDLRKQWNE